MKPFNLELALAGAPVVTRGGSKATQIVKFTVAWCDYPIRAVVGDQIFAFTEEGTYTVYRGDNSHRLDLFMKSTKKHGWINIYGNSRVHQGQIYDNEAMALSACDKSVTATIEIEWEE